eukprot:TRINITY_DN2373_c0_g1_i1.p1 TRINITY_DN2373_c0_g1~~TRINITY_DN2373_c0_g1_i1.p1  ORF type:complete len:414 (+),score=103.24 TRINITY_DN2373_c0_g1_i1:86-1327(+)
MDQEESVRHFKEFLRIKSISHEGTAGSNKQAVNYLEKLSKEFGLQTKVVEPVANKPVLIATKLGTDPSLPSILLSSHYDVVPADNEKWTTDPWEAFEDPNGDIFARGTQDMKCVCIQYLEAMNKLRGKQFLRTIHLLWLPDEEIGGAQGMGTFLQDPSYKELNVAVALDEGLANPTDYMTVFYGERAVWWCKVKAVGPTGHGSRFIEGNAMGKLMKSVGHFLDFRAEQEAKYLGHGPGCDHAVVKKEKLGDVVTINLTMLKGGVTTDGGKTFALNVIPSEAEAGFDIRIPPSVPLDEFEAKMKDWTKEDGLSYEFVFKTPEHAVTSINPAENNWWKVFSENLTSQGVKYETEVFPAATDGRYLRSAGIPVFGFSPINNTPILLHDHNEKLNRSVFLKGISIYVSLIADLANVK